GDDEGQAGRAEGPYRVDRRGPGGGLLLVGPDLDHARRRVQAPQGGGQLRGDQAVHPADVLVRALGVGVGVVGGEELLRHRGRGGQALLGERQPGVDVHAAGRGRGGRGGGRRGLRRGGARCRRGGGGRGGGRARGGGPPWQGEPGARAGA